jgi:hypothetical protein
MGVYGRLDRRRSPKFLGDDANPQTSEGCQRDRKCEARDRGGAEFFGRLPCLLQEHSRRRGRGKFLQVVDKSRDRPLSARHNSYQQTGAALFPNTREGLQLLPPDPSCLCPPTPCLQHHGGPRS